MPKRVSLPVRSLYRELRSAARVEAAGGLWLTGVDLNITALTRLTYAVAPAFVARGAGTIINIASVVALTPETLNGVYGASKAYVLAFSHSLQHELAEKGVPEQTLMGIAAMSAAGS